MATTHSARTAIVVTDDPVQDAFGFLMASRDIDVAVFESPAKAYLRVKREHPDAILLFRLGDFYETFGEDAERAAPILGITLTSRELGKGQSFALAGVPYHAYESYVGKLLRAGFRVALCDQVEDPATARGLVRREVARLAKEAA